MTFIILLIILFVVLSKKKRQKQAAPPPQNAAAVRQGLDPADIARGERKAALAQAAQAPRPVYHPSPAIARVPDAPGDAAVSGSMPDMFTEGEAPEEHARHADAAKRREAVELLAQAQAANAAATNARRLREAVVMAEVLGKPKALRGRQ